MSKTSTTYQIDVVEMYCIGDAQGTFVVYQPYSVDIHEPAKPSDCVWMVPGTERD